MNELARTFVDLGYLSAETVAGWRRLLLEGDVQPGGAEWDQVLAAEWRKRARETAEAIRDYYDSDCHLVFQDHMGGAWASSLPSELVGMDLHGKRVLDYGCGAGRDGRATLALGAEATFVDTAPRLLAGIKAMCAAHGYAVATLRDDESLPSAFFDFAVCVDAFEHLLKPAAALERIVTSLKLGGRLFQKAFFGTHDLAPYHLPENLHYDAEWVALCEGAGLRPVQLENRYEGLWERVR